MPSLKVIDGPGTGERMTLPQRATLGRSRECDLQLKAIEASRFHAEVVLTDGRYVVKDLGSSNGTLVNGAPITEQVLEEGDRITIGEVTLEYLGGGLPGSGDDELGIVTDEVVEAVQPLEVPGYGLGRRVRGDEVSELFAATDEAMDRPVLIEAIDRDHCPDPDEALARLKSAARLTHPALAHTYTAGREGDLVYAVREPATGQSMWELCGKLSADETAAVGVAVAGALAEAHAASVIHGSLRPDRIVRTDGGHVKLLGLGLPSPGVGTLSTQPDLQRHPNRIAYLAPEQLDGARPTAASDVYSLGAVLYHLLCGRTPFVAISEAELEPKIRSEALTPVRELKPEAPVALAHCIETMLARDPADRHGSMADVLGELEAAGQTAAPAPKVVVAAGPSRLSRAAGTEPKGIPPSAIIIAILVLLLLGAVYLLAWIGGLEYIRWGTRQAKPPETSYRPWRQTGTATRSAAVTRLRGRGPLA